MKPSVWIQSSYTVDADTNGEDSYRTRRELKPAKSLREALAAGADPNDHNALHEAVDRGAIGQVQALLKAGAHFDKLNEEGLAPLHLAVRNREDKKVEALLKAGANVDIRVPDAVPDILEALIFSHKEILSVPEEPGQTPAMMAARAGNRPLLDKLRQSGASLDGVLHAAVVGEKEAAWKAEVRLGPFFEREPMVQPLLDEGLDPNAICSAQFQTYRKPGSFTSRNQGGEGNTPLHLCCDVTMPEAAFGLEPARALLSAGADPNRGNIRGDTPLHLVENDQLASVLIDAGADPHQKNHDGQTPEDTVYNAAVKSLFRKHQLGRVAHASRPQPDLADPDEVLARRGRGRFM